MARLSLVLLLLIGTLAFVSAEITPRFPPPQPVSVGDGNGNQVTGRVLPCDYDYYRIETFNNVAVGDWFRITFTQTPEAAGDFGSLFVVFSEFDNLEQELNNNDNIIDTLGELPGPDNFDYRCDGATCTIELSCELQDGTYYLAISGGAVSINQYSFSLSESTVEIVELDNGEPLVVLDAQRVLPPPEARVYNYAFYSVEIPESLRTEGAYLLVNVSRVSTPGTTVRLFYEDIPVSTDDSGVLDSDDGSCVYQGCVDTSVAPGQPSFDYPINTQDRIPCACTTFEQVIGNGRQLTCNITVDPCQMRYGTWYISVELPFRNGQNDPANLDFTIFAILIPQFTTTLDRNTTYKGFVAPESQTHYKLEVPTTEVVAGDSHLFVQIDNVRNGFVDIWVHKGEDDQADPRAGGLEGCYVANATCRTDDACNVVIERCHFGPGTWYISVSVPYVSGAFLVDDFDRLPITYTIRATWVEDAVPERLIAGVPVHKYIGEALYDFYVIDVPPTIDTWLFVELYVQQEDTEVILSMLHGSLPGGECYDRPDFYCLTGDVRGVQIRTGPPVDFVYTPLSRESCTFMIQTCELEQGPLYLSVYGHHVGYTAYGDTTYYQVPVHYTLYADFDVALSIQSAVSYSELIHERQYNHYYIRADSVVQGSYLSVEITNIQHGVAQTVEAFVNYNFLAGNCPCYDHLYNCTGATAPSCGGEVPSTEPNFLPHPEVVRTCCTILVPACDFRSGVWYISVLGVNEDFVQHTTAIGYTLTATIHEAPVIKPLIPGQLVPDQVAQWNRTNEYTHYKIGAKPIPNHDLVIQLTYVQNCEFLEKHDNLRDTLDVFVNRGGVAGDRCFDYHGSANIQSTSYEVVVVPSCEWTDDDYFVAVQGNFDAVFNGRYTISATVSEISDTQLVSGVSTHGHVSDKRYQHFFIEVPVGISNTDLIIELYINSDVFSNDPFTDDNLNHIVAFVNKDARAGEAPCFDHLDGFRCETESSCTWQIQACQLTAGRYYVSVLAAGHQFFDTAVEFTLTATLQSTVTPLGRDQPFTAHIQVGQIQHYSLTVEDAGLGDYITILVDNVKHGAVQVYYNFNGLAGLCPCYDSIYTCTPVDSTPDNDLTNDWCEIVIPSCEFSNGVHYVSVVGLENTTPNPPLYETPIGYTIEIDYIAPSFVEPDVVRDRFDENTERNQLISDQRYVHYQVDVSDTDYNNGFQVIVEIDNVRDGALNVYWANEDPAHNADQCQAAQICTSGLGAGGSCRWQIPFCLSSPGRHYVTVEGITGRFQASYDILIYLQRPADAVQNEDFTLDNAASNIDFDDGNVANITHFGGNQPNGWVQFIRLDDAVFTDTEDGEILEVFFYNIVNNAGSSVAFDVYIWPEFPAGSDSCCLGSLPGDLNTPSERGNCVNQPCLRTLPLTTYNPGNIGTANSPGAQPTRGAPGARNDDANNNRCLSGVSGSGPAPANSNSPFFGERCIARVWACDVAEANHNGDWWVTVVPVEQPVSTTALSGLSYDVQWRVRDTRTEANSGSVGTTDLNADANTGVTNTFSIQSDTTESEAFASFVLDVDLTEEGVEFHRIVIQTEFLSGTGEVFIQADSFANPLNCYLYRCTSSEDCNGDDRFIATECCGETVQQYYITVRNLGGDESVLSFRFRVSHIDQPEPSEITLPFTISVGGGQDGLRGEEYDFYTFEISDTDFESANSLIVDLTKTSNNGATVQVFLLYDGYAGTDVGQNNDKYPAIEGCFNYELTCSVAAVDQHCYLEQPHCQLLAGTYFVSVYNPNFDFDFDDNNNNNIRASYNLDIFFADDPVALSLGTSQTDTFDARDVRYFQYTLEVTATDIEATNNDVDGFLTNILRVEVTGTAGLVSAFVNFDFIAGSPLELECADFIATGSNCGATGCVFDFIPCDGDFTLKAGTYFIGIRVAGSASWTITASVVSEIYAELTSTSQNGVEHRDGTNNEIYTTNGNQGTSVDGYFRYAINIPGEFTTGRDYLVFNLTTGNSVAGTVNARIWRQDCQIWTCSVSTANSWCVIDAIGLAPCTAEPGTYFIRIENPSNTAFTLNAYHNETTVEEIVEGQTITEITYPNEYQAFYYEATTIGDDASTLTVFVTSTCGAVEVFIQKDTIGGPSADGECAITSCVTVANGDDGTDATFACSLFLDVCTFEQRGYYITVRGTTQTFPNNLNDNLYLPIRYSLYVQQNDVNSRHISAFCTNVVDLVQDSDERDYEPIQFHYDLENVEVGSFLRFSFFVPRQVRDPSETATFTVSYQLPVSYLGSDCDYDRAPLSCTITDGDGVCSIRTTPTCAHLEGRYYIWADAPRGSEVTVELFDASIRLLRDHEKVSATLDNGDFGAFDFPVRSNVQYYRFDIEPRNDDHFMVSVRITDVSQGSVGFTVNDGQWPVAPGQAGPCGQNMYTSPEIEAGDDVVTYLDSCELGFPVELSEHVPTTLWIAVYGVGQDCELHSIKYTLEIRSTEEPDTFEINDEQCDDVRLNEYHFYRLSPRTVPHPQDSIIVFDFEETNGDISVSLFDNDGFHSTLPCSNVFLDVPRGTQGSAPYICGFDNLYFSVFGGELDEDATTDIIDYRFAVREQTITLNPLLNDEVFPIEDPCPSNFRDVAGFDYFFFDASSFNPSETSYISFTIESDFVYSAWLNTHHIGGPLCFDTDSVSGSGSSTLFDLGCNGFATDYYVTVAASGPFTVTAHVEENIVDLAFGESTDVTLSTGVGVFRLTVTEDDITAGSRLTIFTSDIKGGFLEYFFNLDGRAGETISDPFTVETCAFQHYSIDLRTSESFDYFQLSSCDFVAGTYWITIRTYNEDLLSACDSATFTLTPQVISYEFDITDVELNATITDEVVHRIPRDTNSETPYRFYRIEATDGSYDSLGQLSIRNVQGGVVTAYISHQTFPLPSNVWVNGQVTGLSATGYIRSGIRSSTDVFPLSYEQLVEFNVQFVGVNTANQIVIFNSASPSQAASFPLTSLPNGVSIVGADFRPTTGELFALGSDSRLYIINPSGTVEPVSTTAFATPLSGTAFGFDFNPTVDRIRVTSDNGQNLRLNPINGALGAVDTAITPSSSRAVACAYTNSFAGSTSTTLYVIDSATDSLYTQGGLNSVPSPNGGVLQLVGPLGVDTSDIAGFDILPEEAIGFATLNVPGTSTSGLYLIDLTTGAASLIGPIGSDAPLSSLATIIVLSTPTTGEGCADASCTSVDGSCSITLSPCLWESGPFHVVVAAEEQFGDDAGVTYDLVLTEYPQYRNILPNHNHIDSFDGNTANHYYAGITDGQQSVRFRTQVINGDGVLVTVRNHECPEQATWTREVFCSGRFYDHPFMCDIDISTRAQHPGALTTTFFATVSGTNATFSIGFYAGRQNCHEFSASGVRDGLDFCAGLVPYATYRWDNYAKRDESARCLFNELYDHFRVQPCWSGVTPECNSTLQRFACYENFHRCDEDGFAVGTCRKACEAVVFECVNWFESVDLEHYNCTSDRYVENYETCTGHLESDIFDDNANLVDDPLDLIFEIEAERARGSASSLSAVFSLVFAAVALVFFGLF